jgi:hypothetical protein
MDVMDDTHLAAIDYDVATNVMKWELGRTLTSAPNSINRVWRDYWHNAGESTYKRAMPDDKRSFRPSSILSDAMLVVAKLTEQANTQFTLVYSNGEWYATLHSLFIPVSTDADEDDEYPRAFTSDNWDTPALAICDLALKIFSKES